MSNFGFPSDSDETVVRPRHPSSPPVPPHAAPPQQAYQQPHGHHQTHAHDQPHAYNQPQMYSAPAGYIPVGGSVGFVKGSRPKVRAGAILMVAGAALALVGTLLPWASGQGESINGYGEFSWVGGIVFFSLDSPATYNIIGAVIMVGLGLATLAAGRVLAVTIMGIIAGLLGVLIASFMLILILGFTDSTGFNLGIGIVLQPIAPMMSLVGAVMATAKKRPLATPVAF